MTKAQSGFLGHLLTVVAFTAVVGAFVGFVLYKSGALPSVDSPYTVRAVVPSASLLTPGARVTVAGAEVGSVTKIERAVTLGSGSILTLELTDKRVTPLPTDSRVQIRTRTQVGENYVSITVGRARRDVPDNGTLSEEDADPLVDVDQVLSVLRGRSKDDARRLFAEFGRLLTGRQQDLNRTIAGLNPTINYGTQLVEVLRQQRGTVARLVDELGRVTAAVGDRGEAIRTIAQRGVTSLQAIGDRDRELAATLRELPSTLTEVRRATTTIGNVGARAAPVVENLATAVFRLRPAVRDLGPASSAGRGIVASLARANPALDRLLRSASTATALLPQALPAIRSTFCQLNPALRYLLPYKDDVLQSAFHFGSGANAYDATGHIVRLVPILNENSLSGAPPAVLSAAHTLLSSGAFLPQKVISYDPYMKPGDIGKSVAKSGEPTGPESLKASGYMYPRVEADC